MPNNNERKRQAQNFLEQSHYSSDMLEPMPLLKNIPCKSCQQTSNFILDKEQARVLSPTGVTLKYKCSNCGSEAEVLVEM